MWSEDVSIRTTVSSKGHSWTPTTVLPNQSFWGGAQKVPFLINYPGILQHTEAWTPSPKNLNATPRSSPADCPFPKLALSKKVNKWALHILQGRALADSRVIQEGKSPSFSMRHRSAHLTLCFGAFVSNWHFNFKTVHKTPFNYLAPYRFYITLEVTDSIHFPSNYKTD